MMSNPKLKGRSIILKLGMQADRGSRLLLDSQAVTTHYDQD